MKIAELTSYIHSMHCKISGHPQQTRMTWNQLWNVALACPKNKISNIKLSYQYDLPSFLEGAFFRVANSDGSFTARVLLDRAIRHTARHEFVLVKELMHCWSEPSSWVKDPDAAKELLSNLYHRHPLSKDSFTDYLGLIAAANVMLPHEALYQEIRQGHTAHQIANLHNMEEEVVKMMMEYTFKTLIDTAEF